MTDGAGTKAKNNDLMAALNAVLDNEDISQAEVRILARPTASS